MTHKDYAKLADMVAGFREKNTGFSRVHVSLDDLTESLVNILSNDNPRFQGDKFRAACDPNWISRI